MSEASAPAETAPFANTEDLAKLRKEITDLRHEAAERRIAARNAEAEAAAAKLRVADLEPYESAARDEAESLKRDLGDRAAVVEGLTPAQALRVLRTIKAAAAGPGAVRNTTSGYPPPVAASQPDLSRMTPDDLRQYMQSLPIDQVRTLAEQHGVSARRRNVFG